MPRKEPATVVARAAVSFRVSFRARPPFVQRTVSLFGLTFGTALHRKREWLRPVGLFFAIVAFGLLHTVGAAGHRSLVCAD